jgi:D-sedoheptulose 7-phosphate isomerase
VTLAERAQAHLLGSLEVKRQLVETGLQAIQNAAALIAEAFRAHHKLLLCGNGGSAADCQHMAAEFVGRLTKEHQRPGLPAIALTTDTSFITAHANDVAFDDIFHRQVQALGLAGDVLLGFSTSGNSPNVVRAVQLARSMGLHTIALTGNAGQLSSLVDVCVSVPSAKTAYIQEAHLVVEHIICDLVEQELLQSA